MHFFITFGISYHIASDCNFISCVMTGKLFCFSNKQEQFSGSACVYLLTLKPLTFTLQDLGSVGEGEMSFPTHPPTRA